MSLRRALTWIDFTVCALLALPFTAPAFISLMSALNVMLGGQTFSAPTGSGAFFVNLAGVLGVLWNIAMLKREDRNLHITDLAGRAGVIALVLWHMVASGLAIIFAVFIATELIGGLVKARWLANPKTV